MNSQPDVIPTPLDHPAFTIFHLNLDGQPVQVTLIHPEDLPRTLARKNEQGVSFVPLKLDEKPVTLDSRLGLWLRRSRVGDEATLVLSARTGKAVRVSVVSIGSPSRKADAA